MSEPHSALGHGGLFPHPHGEQGSLTDQPDPLDVAQEFEQATSYEVRDELEDLVRRDLLGPWDGEHEQFAPPAQGPRERYLVGMLGPKHAPKSAVDEAGDVPDTESGVQGGAEAELPDVLTPQNLGRIWASSMGMTFAVPDDVDALAVSVTWGRYGKQEIEDADGKSRSTWFREPVAYEREVRLDGSLVECSAPAHRDRPSSQSVETLQGAGRRRTPPRPAGGRNTPPALRPRRRSARRCRPMAAPSR